MLLEAEPKKNKSLLSMPYYRKKFFKYIENHDVFLFSEHICKSCPPKECSDKELDIIIMNTAHFWNIEHVLERNTRRWRQKYGMEGE